MNIVYSLTRNVYEQLLPSITSLVRYNPKAKIYVICEDDTFPFDLPGKPTVINASGQEWFTAENCINYFNRFTYINLLKVVYPSLLPRMNKVIHLDIDTIICGSLEELWKTDVSGKWFAACPEYTGHYKPFGDTYYNMGVALINLQQMRKDGIEADMVNYLCAVSQPWADQDAWNKYGIEQDKAALLDVRFNESRMTGRTDQPVIVHYCSISDWFDNRNIERAEYLAEYLPR